MHWLMVLELLEVLLLVLVEVEVLCALLVLEWLVPPPLPPTPVSSS
jgi:hypothetical protein